jgi:choline dehydrogenase-like flavoprotein
LKATDLNKHRISEEQYCDVCIVGGGAAGLYLARRLAQLGKDVIVLEAGGETNASPSDIGFEPEFGAEYYSGAVSGRFFGLGGSTSNWGGALVPHSDIDVKSENEQEQLLWASVVDRVKQNTAKVLQQLSLVDERGFSSAASEYLRVLHASFLEKGMTPFSAVYLPFRRKNLRFLIEKNDFPKDKLRVFLHAVVSQWTLTPGEHGSEKIIYCEARNLAGNRVKVRAGQYVIAAGGIESARILLELQQQSKTSAFQKNQVVGRYLSDHLSCMVGTIASKDWITIATLFGPRFEGNTMRSFRFLQRGHGADTPRAFLHFIFEINNPGFVLAKKIFGGLQARKIPKTRASEWFSGATGLLGLGYDKYIKQRLHIPKGTSVHLQLDMEQAPCAGNRIELSDRLDAYGRQTVRIHWKIADADLEKIAATANQFISQWSSIPELPPIQAVHTLDANAKPHDAYHPVGTCRMGADAQTAVVDLDLAVHGVENVSVLSTAVLPTAGTANPTFTMLCLGESLAQKLAQ